MKNRILRIIAALTLFGLLIMVGCTKNTPTSRVFIVATPVHNGLYNPLYATTVYDEDVCNLIFEGLTVQDSQGITQINSRLVKNLEISAEGTEYTFTLYPEIRFSNKTKLTAEDVVFTYQTLADPSSTAFRHQLARTLKGGEAYMEEQDASFQAVEALDETTVVFRFAKASRQNLYYAGVPILSRQYYPDWQYGQADFYMHEKMTAPMGSGPYILEEYVAGKYVQLRKNPNYWANDETDYRLDVIRMDFLTMSESLTRLAEGTIDLIPEIQAPKEIREAETVAGSTAHDLHFYAKNSYGFFGFHTTNGATADPTLRQALALAFDKEQAVKDAFGEFAIPVAASIPAPSNLYSLIGQELEPYLYDLDAAKTLLLKAGYTGIGTALKDPKGSPVTITFLLSSENTTAQILLKQLEQSCNTLGIELNAKSVTYSELIDTIQTDKPTWNMFFMADSWYGNDPAQWELYFSSTAGRLTNVTQYSNPTVDKLLQEANLSLQADSPKARRAYHTILLELNRDLPELPIYTRQVVSVVSQDIQGMQYNSYQRWSERIEGVSWKPAEE